MLLKEEVKLEARNGRSHYVYIVLQESTIVYIGKGEGRRFEHVNSGKSHSRAINELQFKSELLGEPPICINTLIYFSSKEEALLFEKQLIRYYRPICNIVYKVVKKFATVKTKRNKKLPKIKVKPDKKPNVKLSVLVDSEGNDIDRRVFNGGLNKSYPCILGMSQGERRAYYRWIKKAFGEGHTFDVACEEDKATVTSWLESKRGN